MLNYDDIYIYIYIYIYIHWAGVGITYQERTLPLVTAVPNNTQKLTKEFVKGDSNFNDAPGC